MRYKNISVFVFIGAFAIIILQLLWLYNTYVALEDNLYKESNTILIKAIRREISIRFKKAPKGTEIVGVSIPANAQKNELAPEIVSLNEGLSDIGLEMSISKIDSIASNMLNETDLPCLISINKIRISDNKVLYSSNPKSSIFPWGKIKSKIINITADSSYGIIRNSACTPKPIQISFWENEFTYHNYYCCTKFYNRLYYFPNKNHIKASSYITNP